MTTAFKTHEFGTRLGPLPVRVAGDSRGRLVVALHGMLTDGRLWDKVVDQLTTARPGQVRVALPDLPLGAHARPVPERKTLTPDAVADAVLDITGQLGGPPAVLAGNDTGGAIAQLAAARRPGLFAALVLTSCDALDHFPPPALRPLRAAIRLPGVTRALVWAFGLPPLLARPGPLNLVARRPIDQELVSVWLGHAADREVRRDFAAFYSACDNGLTLRAAESLRSYPGPVVIAWSRGDRLFPEHDANRLAEIVPHAHLQPIDDALTFSPLDQPGSVAQAIIHAIDQLPRMEPADDRGPGGPPANPAA